MGHFHVQGLGQVTCWITHQLHHAQASLLVLGPCLHDGSVVDAVHNDSVNPSLAESVLILQVVGDLLCGSGGCEGPWQSKQHHRLVLREVGEVVLLRRESLVQLDGGHGVSHGGERAERQVGSGFQSGGGRGRG
uniref:Uncharacterized protein n=1 Tax=Craspedostauros australis TaxID=1486917 RepID=A0A7R9WX44_9STRA